MNIISISDIKNTLKEYDYLWVLLLVWLLLITFSITRIISYSPKSNEFPFLLIATLNTIRWTIVISSVFLFYKIAGFIRKTVLGIFYHFIICTLLTFTVTLLYTLPEQLYFNGLDLNLTDFIQSIKFNFQGLIIVVPILYLITIGYHYYKSSFDEFTKEKFNQEKLEKDLMEAKLAVFRSQLDPHFLFNTLQAINTLIEFDQDKAKLTLAYLSNILELMESRKDENVIELRNELVLVEQYLRIEKTRYPKTLLVQKEIEENSLHAMIPTYSIQLLVENAIKHGISKSIFTEIIIIRTQIQEDILEVIVENSAKSFDFENINSNDGIGLSNIKSRLERMYNNSQFKISKSELGGLKVKFSLPLKVNQKVKYYEEY